MKIRVLNAADVRRALPMDQAVAGMKTAYARLSANDAVTPLRTRIDVEDVQGATLFMPAFIPTEDALAVKIVSVFPENVQRGEPTISGLVLALDSRSGRPLALLEGGTLTAIRTGAGSGAATDLLARPDARVAAIIGSGVQARTQLESVCTVRQIRSVRVYSPHHEHALAFTEEVRGEGPIPTEVTVASSSAEAVAGADIICTATTSRTPVFPGSALAPGAHVNAVGSFMPSMREVDVVTLQNARIVVDSREAVLSEAGELIAAFESGALTHADVHAELGEIVNGTRKGRESADEITFFKSVGVAVQDAMAAQIALYNAATSDIGTVISLA